MTRARITAKGLVTPPPLHHWMEAVLLLCVSLVQGAVSTLKMILVRRTRECHTKAPPADLPQATSSTHQEGTILVPPGSRPAVDAQRRNATLPNHAPAFILRDDRRYASIPQDEASGRCRRDEAQEALILRDLRSAQIVSKDEGVLTGVATLIKDKLALSPLMPTNVGIQGRPRTLYRLVASSLRSQHNRSWIPTLILSLSKDVGISGACRKQLRTKSA